jgi:hypothetical protein
MCVNDATRFDLQTSPSRILCVVARLARSRQGEAEMALCLALAYLSGNSERLSCQTLVFCGKYADLLQQLIEWRMFVLH